MTAKQAYERLLRYSTQMGKAVGAGMDQGLRYARGVAVIDLQRRPYGGKKKYVGRLWQTVVVNASKETSPGTWTGGLRMGNASVFWGPFVEFGTGRFVGRPGWTIVPKRKKALRWTEPGGEIVFAKKVEQHGAPPHPALKPALEQGIPVIRREISLALIKAAEDLGLR